MIESILDFWIVLSGFILMVDGIVSILLQLKDNWWYHLGRVGRIVIGIFVCVVGGCLVTLPILFMQAIIVSIFLDDIVRRLDERKN